MKKVVVDQYGPPEVLRVVEAPTPEPGPHEVCVRLTSVGMNHADLMARRGEYKLLSGDPPFTPGMEGGGVIHAVGEGVTDRQVGQRVIIGLDAPRLRSRGASLDGTYRTHYIASADKTVVAPPADVLPDEHLGAIWLAYFTAWGCLVHEQRLGAGQVVGIGAASSSVALAAAQVVKARGGVAVGMTSSPDKVGQLKSMPEAVFDHLVLTRDEAGEPLPWHKDIKQLTDGRGVDVFFDPVAAGAYLESEIRCLAPGGTVWVYGLLGKPDKVDVSPLIIKQGALRGYVNDGLIRAGAGALQPGYEHILAGFASGAYRLPVAQTFTLDEVREAHEVMQRGEHIGKLIIRPDR